MKIPRNNHILTLFIATFIIFAGVLFFGEINSAHAAGDCSKTGGFRKFLCEQKELYSDFYGGAYNDAKEGVKNVAADAATGIVTFVLLVILEVVSWFLNVSIALLKLGIDPTSVKDILLNPAIYETWGIIRDLCNLLFILILLFSAFATIFQASKYSYKNTLLWVIIMALLVNFSHPITLFIIDISNSLMYTLLKQIFNKAGTDIITTQYLFGSDLTTIMTPKNPTPSSLFVSIIFIFILFLTILSLSLILIVRTIGLAIIIIFSPIGFVGKIIDKDGGWWDYLFKYAMAGPIIALVLLISTKLMAATLGDIDTAGTEDIPVIASMASLIIPVIILWMGMGFAIKGIDGSGAVMGKIRGGGVGLAKKFGNGMWRSTGVPGGFKKAADHYGKKGAPGFLGKIPGLRGSEKTEATEAWVAGKLGVKGSVEGLERDKISEIRKKWKDNGGATDTDIADALAGGGLKAKAAAMEAAEKVGFGNGPAATANYQNAVRALGGKNDAKLKSIFDDKVKEKHINLVIDNDIATNPGKNRADVYKEYLDKLTPEELAKQKGLHNSLAGNADLQNYILHEVAPDAEYHKEFFKKLNREQRKAYINASLNP